MLPTESGIRVMPAGISLFGVVYSPWLGRRSFGSLKSPSFHEFRRREIKGKSYQQCTNAYRLGDSLHRSLRPVWQVPY